METHLTSLRINNARPADPGPLSIKKCLQFTRIPITNKDQGTESMLVVNDIKVLSLLNKTKHHT